jgi:hypothetical protein
MSTHDGFVEDIARRLAVVESISGQLDTIAHRLRMVEDAQGRTMAGQDTLTDEVRGLTEQVKIQNGRVTKNENAVAELASREEHRQEVEQFAGWFNAGKDANRKEWAARWNTVLDWAGNGTVRTVTLGITVILLGLLGLAGLAEEVRGYLP